MTSSGGRSSNHRQLCEYWMPAFAGMTARRETRAFAVAAVALNRLQRRHHIVDQIVGMLEPARQADHAVADAELGALLRLEPLVRRRRRMGDQALGIAEVVGDAHKLE